MIQYSIICYKYGHSSAPKRFQDMVFSAFDVKFQKYNDWPHPDAGIFGRQRPPGSIQENCRLKSHSTLCIIKTQTNWKSASRPSYKNEFMLPWARLGRRDEITIEHPIHGGPYIRESPIWRVDIGTPVYPYRRNQVSKGVATPFCRPFETRQPLKPI